jgi:hypothetical protein
MNEKEQMKEFNIYGKVNINIFTAIWAETEEEAIKIVQEHIIESLPMYNDDITFDIYSIKKPEPDGK